MSRIIKLLIISEFFWSSPWNAITPVFSVFALKSIPGASLTMATTAYGLHLVVRILIEIFGATLFARLRNSRSQITVILWGICIVTVGYAGFALISSFWLSYFFYALLGLGIGMVTPPKLAFFSTHIRKGKEALAWSVLDVTSLTGAALAALVAGSVIHEWGFSVLFGLSACLNLLGAVPYLLMLQRRKSRKR